MSILQSAIKKKKIELTTSVIFVFAAGCASQGSNSATEAALATEATTAMNANTATESTSPFQESKSTRLICRKIKPTGSRFGERVCMRPEQWENYDGDGKRETELAEWLKKSSPNQQN